MKTKEQFNALLADVLVPGYTFHLGEKGDNFWLKAVYLEPDTYTGKLMEQHTRKWLLSPHMVDSEVIQTAFKCVQNSFEHRVREAFTYKGRRIFGPHIDVDALWDVAERTEIR